MQVKTIELVFENCECITFNAKDVLLFGIGDITEAYSSFMNGISLHSTIDEFYIVIRKAVLPDSSGLFNPDTNPLDRLLVPDITQIHVTFEDDSTREYYVLWNSNDEDDNNNSINLDQSVITSINGNIIIDCNSFLDEVMDGDDVIAVVDEIGDIRC